MDDYAAIMFNESDGYWGSLMLVQTGVFFSESGEIIISRSTQSNIVATEFTASDVEVGTVTITAIFNAKRISGFAPLIL